MTGRVKRQSGSEATKRPVFPDEGNTVPYGRQPVEKYFCFQVLYLFVEQ
jgi:hypothetical protein